MFLKMDLFPSQRERQEGPVATVTVDILRPVTLLYAVFQLRTKRRPISEKFCYFLIITKLIEFLNRII